MYGATIDVRNTLRGTSPRIPFEKIARAILPTHYELSVVVCGDTLSKRINGAYSLPARGARAGKKDYAPNVLSFSLEKGAGEIFLNIRKAEREAPKYGVSPRAHAARLYIHGCFHLKGYKHGMIMEAAERSVLKKFGFYG